MTAFKLVLELCLLSCKTLVLKQTGFDHTHFPSASTGRTCEDLGGDERMERRTEDACPQELTTDPGYFSTSPSQQLQYSRHSAQTTPNTPSSIPDIVLTDFSSTAEELASRAEAELAKELGCAMAGSFDSDLFLSDDCLREGLVPIDVDGLQMLTDPTEIITDPNAEEHFRLDRIQ
ncbi:CREB-regulated transcription coactivator 1 [Homalodisca vitripennis]|nr:CREB-regulated transcription coactivator 1 [Homalodisca vitripennis]